MSNNSQIQSIIDSVKELQKTSDYCCIALQVSEIIVIKLLRFILPSHLNSTVPMAVNITFQPFTIDNARATFVHPKTLKENWNSFQEKITQDLRLILLTPYKGFKDFCYTLLSCPINSIGALAGLAISLALIAAIYAITIALLTLSVVGLIIASPFSPKMREYMTKENAGILGRAALVMLSIFPALTPFLTATLLSVIPLSVTSIFTRAGTTVNSAINYLASNDEAPPCPTP